MSTLLPLAETTVAPPAEAGRTLLLIRAGEQPARTSQTLSSALIEADPRVDVALTGARDRCARVPSIPGRVRVMEGSQLNPERLAGFRQIVILEDGARLPAGWHARLAGHAGRNPEADALAACTNHAAGPERLPGDVLSAPLLRYDSDRWRGLCGTMEERWAGVSEDCSAVSSPFLSLRPHALNASALHRYLATPVLGEPLRLRPTARLVLCWDLPVWREPRRNATVLRAVAGDPTLRPADAALRWFGRFSTEPDVDPTPTEHLQLATVAVRTGRLDAAVDHAGACLRHWPGQVDARIWLAEAQIKAGKGESARAQLDALQQAVPLSDARRGHLLACLGESWRQAGEGEQAERCLEASLALDPLQALALDSLGMVALEAGRFDAALRSFQRAVRADTTYAGAWSNLGRAWAMDGEHERAREALVRALAIQPGQREARALLARIA